MSSGGSAATVPQSEATGAMVEPLRSLPVRSLQALEPDMRWASLRRRLQRCRRLSPQACKI